MKTKRERDMVGDGDHGDHHDDDNDDDAVVERRPSKVLKEAKKKAVNGRST